MAASTSRGKVFAHLKHRCRSSFVGQHRLDVIVHGRLEHGPKYISLSTLKSSFGVAGLVLTEEEVDYVIKRFADNRRRIEWRRLMVALDVAAPIDFNDPDQSFLDNLPQPYRLIVSVLETEIVDRAWALIVERHPELETSPKDEARAAADIDLKRSCPPPVRLHNPHPPLFGGRRVAEATAAANGNTNDGVSSIQPAGRDDRHDGEGDRGGSDDGAAQDGARGGDGGVTFLRWDQRGELLFTAGRDGSVCLRVAGALEDIAVQASSRSCRSTSSNGKEEMVGDEAMSGVTFLSEPAGDFSDRWGRPSSVRIAAVTTSTEQKDMRADGEDGAITADGGGEDSATVTGGRPSSPLSAVAVLEAAVPESELGDTIGTGNLPYDNDISDGPTFRVICEVELSSSEAAVSCALSPDGRRLAVCLADGRIVTWVLPVFSRLSGGSQWHKSGEGVGERPGSAGDRIGADGTKNQLGGKGDGVASLGDSSTSLGGTDEAAAVAKKAAAAAEAAASGPLRITRPEFSIPHLPSPEELDYAKAVQEYRRRVECGELHEPPDGGGEVEEGCTPPPRAPQLSGCAHHLARVDFLPTAAGHDGGGGLSVWRVNSNVWRLYRLPPPPSDGEGGAEDSGGVENGADTTSGENADQNCREAVPLLPAKFDISSLPAAEWILPSPITALAVSEGDEAGGQGGGGLEEGDRRVHRFGGGAGCAWGCYGNTSSTAELAPVVAIGTENGGVFLCDAALSTTREALSRHRARVTTLAFHRKRFLVSGSADEMLQVHHIAAANGIGGGGICCGGGTPRLRCLHDARGSGIVRVACLREAPLTLAEDASGRIVAYDLLTGSMLGVLALGDSSTASATVDKPSVNGGVGVTASAKTIIQKPGVVWAGGGNHLAAVISEEKGKSSALSPALPASNEILGVWSGSDVMWDLSPGLRAIAGNERPSDVGALFFGLLPAQRKNAEGKVGIDSPFPQPPPSPPTAAGHSRTHRSDNDHSRRGATPPPRIGTAGTARRPYHGAEAAGGRSSRDIGLGGDDGGSGPPTAPLKTEIDAKYHQNNNHHHPHSTALIEGNVAKLVGAAVGGNRFAGAFAEGGGGAGESGVGGPWRNEVGAVGRAKRYVQERHGDRAARQARLDNATRNLLLAL